MIAHTCHVCGCLNYGPEPHPSEPFACYRCLEMAEFQRMNEPPVPTPEQFEAAKLAEQQARVDCANAYDALLR